MHEAEPMTVDLKEYFDQRLSDLRLLVVDRFTLNDAAVAKAERTMNTRLDGMNEFRDALKDQASRMATRDELRKVDEDVQELRRARSNFDGRLIVFSGGVAVATTVLLWLLTQFAH